LVDLGYEVALNVMQADGLGDSAQALARQVEGYGCVHLLYFADSLGCMSPEDVGELIGAARRGWQGDIGFHAHDNMQEAVWNCRAAIEAGARWVDGTVCGMGRGAGNASTHAVAMYLGKKTEPTRQLAMRHFIALQKTHGWGYNDFYLDAADKRVHPSYVQEMLVQGVESKRIYEVIDALHQGGGRHYSQETLARLLRPDVATTDLKTEKI
jgi:4-hydroxy 2-oxovalerate aldolase